MHVISRRYFSMSFFLRFQVRGLIVLFLLAFLSSLSACTAPASRTIDLNERAWEEKITATERAWEKAYEGYFGQDKGSLTLTTPTDITAVLERLRKKSGQPASLIYLKPTPKQLEILFLTPGRAPVYREVRAAARNTLLPVVQSFSAAIARPGTGANLAYLADAQQLYQWIIEPIEAELAASTTSILLFCMGEGLRTLPLAALHDGKKFLIERYNPVRIPAFNLMKTRYMPKDEQTPVIALGASLFDGLPDLPGVAIELASIATTAADGIQLNEKFTQASLRQVLEKKKYPVVHLATHAVFSPGQPQASFIALWKDKLDLYELGNLPWEDAGVDLLVLSACQTALGDKETELGFAGIAFQTGVDTVIASLWPVSDAGALALMSEFYYRLRHDKSTKAEALRQAQLDLLHNNVRIEQGKLRGSQREKSGQQPQTLTSYENISFEHPFFWAAFTLVGSPW